MYLLIWLGLELLFLFYLSYLFSAPLLLFFLYCCCFYKFIYLFIYCALGLCCWVFIAKRGLSLVAVSGGYSSLRYAGFSLRWLLLLQSLGSRRVGFSSCGTWAQ